MHGEIILLPFGPLHTHKPVCFCELGANKGTSALIDMWLLAHS
jgi:hypothetical protein